MVFTNFKNQSSKSLPDKHNKVQLSYAPHKAVFLSSIPKTRKLKKRFLFYRYINSFGACGCTTERKIQKKYCSQKVNENTRKVQKEIANCPSISPIHDGK